MTGWSRASAIWGGLVWLVLLVALPLRTDEATLIEWLLLLAVLVFTPLAFSLVATPDRASRHPLSYRAAQSLQPFAAALAVVSFLLPAGIPAALFTLGWLSFTALVALFGLVRFLPRGIARADETCINVGLLYLPVGGVWLVLSRLGAHPLGFSDTIVLLTAVHFHYAGFAALILTGMTGRQLAEVRPFAWNVFRLVSIGVISSPALVAVGITFSLPLEVVAALVLVVSLLVLAFLTVFVVVPEIHHRLARGFLIISAASLAIAMLFACAYAVGEFTGAPIVSISQMVLAHGVLNAFGFILCGLLAWTILRPKSHLPAPGIPFSSLSSRGRVGPDFFYRISAVPNVDDPPLGLVDDLSEYRRVDFNPENIHPDIRSFYEETTQFGLLVSPDWKFGFRLGARIFKYFSARIGQMNFPISAERREDLIDSCIIPIDDSIDGRTNVRAWIRTYTKTGNAVYIAAYATHSMKAQTYMNIVFPLPGGNLTSVLRIESLVMDDGPTGILLTTLPTRDTVGDEGVYFANRVLPIRLPFNETIRVWAVGMRDAPVEDGRLIETATVIARHDIWLFGIKFLTLNYQIFPRKPST